MVCRRQLLLMSRSSLILQSSAVIQTNLTEKGNGLCLLGEHGPRAQLEALPQLSSVFEWVEIGRHRNVRALWPPVLFLL